MPFSCVWRTYRPTTAEIAHLQAGSTVSEVFETFGFRNAAVPQKNMVSTATPTSNATNGSNKHEKYLSGFVQIEDVNFCETGDFKVLVDVETAADFHDDA